MDLNSILPFLNGMNPNGVPNNGVPNNEGANSQAANLLSMMQKGGINRDELVKNMFPQMSSNPLMSMLMQQNTPKKTDGRPIGLSVISNFVPSEILGRLVKYFRL